MVRLSPVEHRYIYPLPLALTFLVPVLNLLSDKKIYIWHIFFSVVLYIDYGSDAFLADIGRFSLTTALFRFEQKDGNDRFC